MFMDSPSEGISTKYTPSVSCLGHGILTVSWPQSDLLNKHSQLVTSFYGLIEDYQNDSPGPPT